MKKIIFTFLSSLIIFLPVLIDNKKVFEISVILWPIALIALLIFSIKKTESCKMVRSEDYPQEEKKKIKRNKKSEEIVEKEENKEKGKRAD